MADEVTTNGDHASGDVAALREVLLSNSTKRRSHELQQLKEELVSEGDSRFQLSQVLDVIFDTYPLYVDARSRKAAEEYLAAGGASVENSDVLSEFATRIQEEAKKKSIAPGNAFVLVRWSSQMMQDAAREKSLWDAHGATLIQALTNAMDTLLASDPKESTRVTAIRVTRRAFRVVFKSAFGDEAIAQCVQLLTAKRATPTPKNAVALGVMAGVCKRLPNRIDALTSHKKDYIDFWLREVLGSKVQLPQYIATGLRDFFESFLDLEDVARDLVPTIEKALLRAPEVVLNDLTSPLFSALPINHDLSETLAQHLLKPLLTNIKSTNLAVRAGAASTFVVLAGRSNDDAQLAKIADEILGPLKANKIPAADQRAMHVQLLSSLPAKESLATSITAGLIAVVAKEANEAAAAAEISAIALFTALSLRHGASISRDVAGAFTKGLAEKRLPMRRLWALRLAEVVWVLEDGPAKEHVLATLLDPSISPLLESFNEASTNQIPAIQNGQASIAFAATAICVAKVSGSVDLKSTGAIKKAQVLDKVLTLEPKPSILLNPRVYTKLTADDDLKWFARALGAVFPKMAHMDDGRAVQTAWMQAMLYLLCSDSVTPLIRKEATLLLQKLYFSDPVPTSSIVIGGLWQWCQDIESSAKDSAAMLSNAGRTQLYKAVRTICPDAEAVSKSGKAMHFSIMSEQMTGLLVLCQSQLLPRVPWIELCLKTGVDPGALATASASACLQVVLAVTENPSYRELSSFQAAAYSALAELAFVAPETMTPLLVKQISTDLDPLQLSDVGPTEAAIYRTPEGTAFVDVLSTAAPAQAISKNTKDYDTLKWEEELRTSLAQKKGQTKKLTPDQQAKVNAQLAKEASIRKHVSQVDARFRRGIGVVAALATGPPTEAEAWFGPSVKLLFEAIEAGAGLIVGDAAALGYLQCADRTSQRLGPLRPFVGVATLRAAGVTVLPAELTIEPLGDLVTRLLYRLRSLGEQRPFDSVTLSYVLSLIFLVLENGGIDRSEQEDADEQIILAVEFLSFHTSTCTDPRLPREKLIQTLISAMQRYTQHFRPLKDCFTDLCRCIAPSMITAETDITVKGAIVADPSVRGAVLQAISAELELSDRDFYVEIWLACHDDVDEHRAIAQEIWEENDLKIDPGAPVEILTYLESSDSQLRRAAARAMAMAVEDQPGSFEETLNRLQATYLERAKPRKPELDKYGLVVKKSSQDPWEARHGIALALKELAAIFPDQDLVRFLNFMIESGPLGDASATVRDSMVDAAATVVRLRGKAQVEPLMKLCETTLEGSGSASAQQDLVNEAVVILYGALAQHLPNGDERTPKVVQRLLATLSTPSESVQYAVSQCLPPLVRASSDQAGAYLAQMIDETLHSKKYAARRGAAYGLGGVIKGKGISILREARVMSTLRSATENKKDVNERQGAYLAYEILSLLLGRIFEPYVIQIVPQLLAGFGDATADVRDACLDASKTAFSSLSSFGVKQVLPILLQGLDEQQWRSKKGACDSLGAMAYLDPQQLAVSLPEIIPPLTDVLNDSHKEVRMSANKSLQRFGEVIGNPEVKSQVSILLKALSDPTKYTDTALDALIKVNFLHYIDAPSLALIVRILERGLGDRSGTKRKASQIIGSLAHLTERKDLIAHLPILVAGLRVAIVDPVPTTRATASKALGSTVEKLGEDALPDLIPSLMQTLKSDTGAGDRLGSAQALSEVLAGLGTGRLEETLPTILQNVSSSKAAVREGFMSLFIFLPACFGNSFANYLAKVIPPILGGLADDVESIRETSLRAGRLLVKNFATRSIDLLLPELERGLADDSYRIRLSSVELVGDLLFNLTGISGKAEQDEVEENANEAGASLLEVLGEERRNKVLSALYICRNDTSGLVRTAAINVWKALVSSPRTLRELVPTLTQLLIRRLASSNMEQKIIAGNALGELIRKAGEGVLTTLLPTLEEALQTSTDTDARQGICIALREVISSSVPEALEDYEKTLISVVRTALTDPDEDVREAAAEAFDSLQKMFGKSAINQVLPHLLEMLRTESEAENAMSALLTLLTESTRSNAILPNLLPTLLTPPITAFNARALASLAEVASSAMTRRLPNILNALMDSIIGTKDEALQEELSNSFDTILMSVDEYDGLNTMMSAMLALVKHDDHRRRCRADMRLAKFFTDADVDFSRYYPDLIRALLIAFDDRDPETVKAAWTALTALTQRLRKEEMESLVISTRQTLNHVGVAGHALPGFSLPKGINAILSIFLQGLMNGSTEQRTQAALAISDLIDRTSADGLKPFVTQITGPLIRVVSERSTELKAAILLTLNNLLEKIPTFLKPFLPQLQRTFAKSLADPTSEVLRSRAAKALGTLITMTPRIDPLIAELVTGSKTSDSGVRNAMLKALYEVVSKAGANMSEVSRNSILGLIDSDQEEQDDAMTITYARLLGALIAKLPPDGSTGLIKSRVVTNHFTKSSVLALNAVLVESPETLTTGSFADITPAVLVQGITSSNPYTASNCVLAAGKWLLSPATEKSYDSTKPLFDALAHVIAPGAPVDTRRLALVVVRTVARTDNALVRPHLPTLAPPIFASVRDMVIPVKLSAEAAFLAIFDVVEEESEVFDKYMAGPAGQALAPGPKRSMAEYFKRVALRLSGQAKERKEAEGGQGGLGLSGDEREDEREIWSVGRVEMGEGVFEE